MPQRLSALLRVVGCRPSAISAPGTAVTLQLLPWSLVADGGPSSAFFTIHRRIQPGLPQWVTNALHAPGR